MHLLQDLNPSFKSYHKSQIHIFYSFLGGVLLEENPWDCSCDLLWLGQWLQRWLRETFHVHMLSVEAALYVNTVSRNAKCSMRGSNISYSIIDLRRSDLKCESAINAFAILVPRYWNVFMSVCLLCHFVHFAQSV